MRKNQKQNRQPSHKKLYGLLAISILLIAAFSYNTYSSYRDTQLDRADRQRFETVHHSVSLLHKRLQKAATPSVEWEMQAFCREGSVKFQEPLTSCDIVTSTEILVSNDTEATKLIKKYSRIFNESSHLFKLKRKYEPDPYNFPHSLTNGLDGASYIEKKTGVLCDGSFSIDNDLTENAKKHYLKIRFSCGDYSRELYYPRLDE